MSDPIRAALERLHQYAEIFPVHDTDAILAAARTALAGQQGDEALVDPEHQGEDRQILHVFYDACMSEGGTADEIHLRGLRAVLARWGHQPAPPVPPLKERPDFIAGYREGLADGRRIAEDEETEQQGEGERRWTEGICGDGAAILFDGVMVPVHEVVRALNCHRSQPPAEGEVAELLAELEVAAVTVESEGGDHEAAAVRRAAELLQQQEAEIQRLEQQLETERMRVADEKWALAQILDGQQAEIQGLGAQQTPVPVGMIPVEYWDIDSGARIVSEPSEEGPGGCWVVLNSRHINPLTEFPTAKAAWDALQQAHALPLPQGEVE